MSPILSFAQSAWDKAKNNHKEINASLAFYRFFELDHHGESKTKSGLDYMMKIDLEYQCAHLFSRQAQQIIALRAQGWEGAHWAQETQSRLVCGLGIPHPSENGLLLDRVSGAPYLAGTGLKGLTLDFALEELKNSQVEDEYKKTEALIRAIFGSDGSNSAVGSAHQGRVHFFDAFPDVRSDNGKKPFQTDVINPHYGKYYGSGGSTPPADYLTPVPSYFLTVRRGVPFGFALAARVSRHGQGEEGVIGITAKTLLEKAKGWLQTALREMGAGGKTRVGYGTFGKPVEEGGQNE